MSELDDIKKAQQVREILTNTQTTILTPHLGKGTHLMSSYHRIQFMAKVIEYMVYISAVHGIDKIRGDIILEAVGKTSWYLNSIPSYKELETLLIEMSLGLELLDVEEMGTIKIPNPLHQIYKDQEAEIKQFLGYKFILSAKGWESYQKQEYQILASSFFAAKISRCISYVAIGIALISFVFSLIE